MGDYVQELRRKLYISICIYLSIYTILGFVLRAWNLLDKLPLEAAPHNLFALVIFGIVSYFCQS
jgi:hypothetical protein